LNYHFSLHHLLGEKNIWADTLSRLTGYNKGKTDNTGITVLKEQLFRGIKQEKEKLQIKKLCQEAKCPTQGSEEAAGWDLYSTKEKEILFRGHSLLSTGISITVPPRIYARIAPRSRLVVKNMIGIGAGVIDMDYRGEVKVLLFNHGKQPFLIKDGNWITQMILEKYEKTEIKEVKDSKETKRGVLCCVSTTDNKVNVDRVS
jgi:dUTP pyrophosphatase